MWSEGESSYRFFSSVSLPSRFMSILGKKNEKDKKKTKQKNNINTHTLF